MPCALNMDMLTPQFVSFDLKYLLPHSLALVGIIKKFYRLNLAHTEALEVLPSYK